MKAGFWLRGASGTMAGATASKSKQGVTILREKVNPSNPKTLGQALQRMKLGPAQRFYKAFSELLNNAFQGKKYGDESRTYFLSLCMKAEGPYIQKGVDRFIPAAYRFSEGSLPAVGIEPFSGGASIITLGVKTDGEATPEALATALGVTTDYQITIAVVNNINGMFVPSYVPYTDRLKLADLPEGALAKSDSGNITINPAALGLDMSAMVACAVVLSVQDASGNWLRSTQEMIISNELRASLYSADAMEAAIYSYQDTTSVNSINSEWYYNLGMSQAWGGKLTSSVMPVDSSGTLEDQPVVIGLQQIDGRIKRTVFATSTESTGLIILVGDNGVTTNEAATVDEFVGLNGNGYTVELWKDSYAAQLGF